MAEEPRPKAHLGKADLSVGAMWRRLLAFVVVIGMLALTSFVVLQDIVSQAEATSGALVPLARERTLLTHILVDAAGVVRSQDPAERSVHRANLLAAADELEAVERSIVAQADPANVTSRMPERVRALYLSPPTSLDDRLKGVMVEVRRFAALSEANATDLEPTFQRIEREATLLVDDLEAVVVAYDVEQLRIDQRLRLVAFLIFAAKLATLVFGVFVAFRPPMARIRSEVERLDALRAHLEKRVEERTVTLAHRMEELARSNRDLEQFAYVASHDLQEPLRVVGGALQYVRDHHEKKLDDDAKQLIGYGIDSARRMQVLIQDLLAYSRLDRPVPHDQPVPAEDALADAVKNLRAAIQETGAAVSHDRLPRLGIDRNHLVQLFQNLVGNSIKFRGEKAPRIHVGAVREGPMWHFSVKDNGIGIDPQHKERVFIIFQRLNRGDRYPGSGIGLAICKKIIERHGGRIWFDSPGKGKGTTFHFTLPYREWPKEGRTSVADETIEDPMRERLRKVV